MKKLNFETATNLSFSILWALLAITALIGVIFCNATWHILTTVICSVGFFVCYFDKSETENSEYATSAKNWVDCTYSYLSERIKSFIASHK